MHSAEQVLDAGADCRRLHSQDEEPPPGPQRIQPLGSDGSVAPPGPAPACAETIAGLQLEECLGQTPLFEVWKGRRRDGRECLGHLISGLAGWPEDKIAQLAVRLNALGHASLVPREVMRAASGRIVLLTDFYTWSLRDRLQECLGQQMRGVPRDELLRYLGQAAEALDAMHQRCEVAHLGLSPRCLLLRDGQASLADMGLVQLIWVADGQRPGPLNERYAAPELFDSGAGPRSDQYSLALIYVELLTGLATRRPRNGARPAKGRAPAMPDLDLLPASDRAIVARALRAEPEMRFGSCSEMVAALRGPPAEPQREQASHSAGLPPVIPYGSLFGEQAPSGTVLPALGQLIKELMAADASLPRVHEHNGFRYRRLAGEILEAQFAVRLWPGMMRLKLEGIRQQWNAQVVQKGDSAFLLHVPFQLSFLQRCAGKKSGLEIEVMVEEPNGPDKQRSLAQARIQPVGGGDLVFDRLMKMGPAMLESVRTHLQAQPEQRKQERLPWAQRVRVFPLLPGLDLGEAIEGQAFNISKDGIGCTLPKAPPTREVFLHFDDLARLAPFAILARIVRTRERTQGGWTVGISFGAGETP